jgi:hypothetical protein
MKEPKICSPVLPVNSGSEAFDAGIAETMRSFAKFTLALAKIDPPSANEIVSGENESSAYSKRREPGSRPAWKK